MVHLILAEKPTAAKKMADSILKDYTTKKKYSATYYESSDGIIVASAAGHLFTLKDRVRKTYPNFDLEWHPSYKKNKFTYNFYKLLTYLGKFTDKITIATDLDIEGEVIGYNVFHFLFNKAKVSRMEFSTLTKEELKKSFLNRKEGYNYGLTESGLTRHYLDFFYGVNITKALTSSIKTASNKYHLISSGRVQGPTLALIAEREKEIEDFIPTPFWQINFITKKSEKHRFPEPLTFNYEKDKLWEKEKADKIFEDCNNKNAIIKKTKKTKRNLNPPIPFNLTGLQMESYKVFGFNPSRTQAIAQKLYLQGVISYPRTSSQKLPSSINYKEIIKKLSEMFDAGKKLIGMPLKPNEGKKTDPAHPSIHPTGELPKKLKEEEEKLYSLIVHRFFAIFGKPAERLSIKIIANIDAYLFNCAGVRTIKKNWLELYPYARLQELELPELEIGTVLIVDKLNLFEKETQPPNRYTPASLVRELEKRGLGTKSTRAMIIQTLYNRNYCEGQHIKITNLGRHVVETLKKYAPDFLSEELTAKFEKEMELVEQDKKKKDEVLKEAENLLSKIFREFKKKEKEIGGSLTGSVEETIEEQNTLGECKCGGNLKFIKMYNGSRFVGCSNYPKCKNAYPLPRNCTIEKTGKICEHCGTPILKIIRKGKRTFNMCLDPKCKSKENWGKKKEASSKDTPVAEGEASAEIKDSKETFVQKDGASSTFSQTGEKFSNKMNKTTKKTSVRKRKSKK